MMWLILIPIAAWAIASFVVLGDMFRRRTAIGCLGLLLFPIGPLIWAFSGYSGNKKIVGGVSLGAALIVVGVIGVEYRSAYIDLAPFFEATANDGHRFKLESIGNYGDQRHWVLVYSGFYEPEGDYASTEQLLQVIREELITHIAGYYPPSLKGKAMITLAIPTSSGFIAFYDITGVWQISDSYIGNEI